MTASPTISATELHEPEPQCRDHLEPDRIRQHVWLTRDQYPDDLAVCKGCGRIRDRGAYFPVSPSLMSQLRSLRDDGTKRAQRKLAKIWTTIEAGGPEREELRHYKFMFALLQKLCDAEEAEAAQVER